MYTKNEIKLYVLPRPSAIINDAPLKLVAYYQPPEYNKVLHNFLSGKVFLMYRLKRTA